MKNFCPNCGKKLGKVDYSICPECGERLKFNPFADTDIIECANCYGRGSIQYGFGPFATYETCKVCGGKGKVRI
jgi:DnaJ-class molecular chaperone